MSKYMSILALSGLLYFLILIIIGTVHYENEYHLCKMTPVIAFNRHNYKHTYYNNHPLLYHIHQCCINKITILKIAEPPK